MIDIRNVEKILIKGNREVKVLKNVNIRIQSGEFVSFMGDGNSGKSSLIKIIGCQDRPTTGEYWLYNMIVENLKESELFKIKNTEIGFVSKTFNQLSRTSVIESVELPMMYAGISEKERRQRATTLLKKVRIENKSNYKPNQLSLEERQRFAIARALANNPKIILANEVTDQLDIKKGKGIIDIFQRLNNEGMTVVIAVNNYDIARFSKRIVFFKKGEVMDDIQI
ncbi:ATP-binding cassette domain-containing protein [Wukongibacter baidiensis]|uniref:ABC transporter ATP-binding protein n=1 Tax=Wukongibacter baidiensis TaxID=1723361 RepID=UPI003D7FACA9